MKINTNSNVYIIIYSVVMVVIVAVLLAVASLGLKERQDANVLDDTKKQIVKALGYDAEKTTYKEVVAEAVILNSEGVVTDSDEQNVFAALQNVKATRNAKKFPLLKAVDGSVVVPLFGKGLWDNIWGYIALEPDMNTVKGIVLSHKGETPGLGAEIATDNHQKKYKGKKIFEGENYVGITLKKGGATKDANGEENPHEVDAITGGTKTSDGVTSMIKSCLQSYEPYFKASKATTNEVSNELNTENNGK